MNIINFIDGFGVFEQQLSAIIRQLKEIIFQIAVILLEIAVQEKRLLAEVVAAAFRRAGVGDFA